MASTIVYHVIVIGCGGTGGYFLKEFGRFMRSSHKPILLTIIDGDTVEGHNLDRQCFQEEDIGLPKATVFAEALNVCYQVPDNRIFAYPEYIDSAARLRAIRNHSENQSEYSARSVLFLPVLIGCVDNHAARRVIHEYYSDLHEPAFYFDSANEYSNGEVVFSGRTKKGVTAPPRAALFPNVLDPNEKGRSELSCAELNVHEPQHICTNMLAGNLLLSKVCELLTGTSVPDLGVAIFDVFHMSCTFYPYRDSAVFKRSSENNERRKSGKQPKKAV